MEISPGKGHEQDDEPEVSEDIRDESQIRIVRQDALDEMAPPKPPERRLTHRRWPGRTQPPAGNRAPTQP